MRRVTGKLPRVDGVEKDRKLDDLANLLCDYLGTLQDIVQVSMPGEVDACMREIYRRAGLQPLIA